VHELLGGVVEHRSTDAHDLSDDTKLLQRLYALNILRLEGQEPDTALWTVRVYMNMHCPLLAWCCTVWYCAARHASCTEASGIMQPDFCVLSVLHHSVTDQHS
jgi:hypothetical protein